MWATTNPSSMTPESTDNTDTDATSKRKHIILHPRHEDWVDENNLNLSAYLRDLIDRDMEAQQNSTN